MAVGEDPNKTGLKTDNFAVFESTRFVTTER